MIDIILFLVGAYYYFYTMDNRGFPVYPTWALWLMVAGMPAGLIMAAAFVLK